MLGCRLYQLCVPPHPLAPACACPHWHLPPLPPALPLSPCLPQRLIQQRFFDALPCVLVTGKGVPDLATRWVGLWLQAAHAAR